MVAPKRKSTGKVIITVKNQFQNLIMHKGYVKRYCPGTHPSHGAKLLQKEDQRCYTSHSYPAVQDRGSTDVLQRELPSLLYRKKYHLHGGPPGKERKETSVL